MQSYIFAYKYFLSIVIPLLVGSKTPTSTLGWIGGRFTLSVNARLVNANNQWGLNKKTLIKVALYQSSLCFAFLYKLNKKCRRKADEKLRIPDLLSICKKRR
ncbi:hypothetical protein COD21_09345 [Bacillus cereus]|nr:hypothetical protein COD21_09345 [Bacillus cereus]